MSDKTKERMPGMSPELGETFARLLGFKQNHSTTVLTEEFDKLFRSCGCDPCCHFCLTPLKVGDEFGFMKLAPGASGTACVRCIKEERPPPQVSVSDAERRRTTEKPRGLGFLVFEDT